MIPHLVNPWVTAFKNDPHIVRFSSLLAVFLVIWLIISDCWLYWCPVDHFAQVDRCDVHSDTSDYRYWKFYGQGSKKTFKGCPISGWFTD